MYYYLASPYSSPDPNEVARRVTSVNRVAGLLICQGHIIYSPISHCHPIAMELNMATHADRWRSHDMVMLRHASMLIVLTLPGWRESKGVQGEINAAQAIDIPITYISEQKPSYFASHPSLLQLLTH